MSDPDARITDEAGPSLHRLTVPPEADDDPAGEVETRAYPAGAIIIEQGDTGDAAYFIYEGRVRVRRGERVLCQLGPGHCFGELAVLDGVPRAATVEAETEVQVMRVAAARFRRWFERHPPLAGLLGTMQQAYRRPDGGLVTLHRGTFEGVPCLSSVRRLPDGRRLVITRPTGRDVLVVSTPGAEAPDETLEYRGALGARTLALRGGRAVGFEARGTLEAGVAEVTGRIVSGRAVSDAERARFGWTGSTGVSRSGEALICACVGLTRTQAHAMIAEGGTPDGLRRRCGAGSVCGTCTPAIDALVEPEPPPRRGVLGRLFGRRRKP